VTVPLWFKGPVSQDLIGLAAVWFGSETTTNKPVHFLLGFTGLLSSRINIVLTVITAFHEDRGKIVHL
jgi:hypothetical protein